MPLCAVYICKHLLHWRSSLVVIISILKAGSQVTAKPRAGQCSIYIYISYYLKNKSVQVELHVLNLAGSSLCVCLHICLLPNKNWHSL